MTFKTLVGVGHEIKTAIQGSGSIAGELKSFVTTKRRKSLPLNVTYVSVGASLDGAHWLRIAGGAGGQSRIVGMIDPATNTIGLSSSGVSLARVYLDDRILDLSKPVNLKVGGVVRPQGVVAPSLTAVLESWRSREDEGLVYSAFVEIDPR